MPPLAPKGGNDRVYTPDDLALSIVNHFRPSGRILEPCAGKGAFVRALRGRGELSVCELDNGTDFFQWTQPVDWIVTNPPWSLFRTNAWFMKARQRDIHEAGFGLVEILDVPTPSSPWPQAGFSLGAGWLRRGWTGGTHFSRLNA